MQAFLATFHGIWSIFILVIFLGIIAWVFSAKRKKSFDEAGRIPLDDGD
jgi:cytochrome c oxidase cbb3-type subunit IV